LNPGCSQTFPWLSTLAKSYEEYEFKGLVFHYIPTSGSAVSGTNPALGSIMLQSTYRASDSTPASKTEMMNEYYGCESVPSESFCHPIECDPKENPFNVKYVRSGPVPAGDSILLYDTGTTFLASQGCPAANEGMGDLWVTYEVVFRKPVVRSNVTASTNISWHFNSPTVSTNLFGNGMLGSSGSLNAFTSTNNVIVINPGPAGIYLVTVSLWNYNGSNLITSGGWGSALISGPSNGSLVSPVGSMPNIVSSNANAGSGVSTLTVTFAVQKTDAANITAFQLPTATYTGTISGVYASISLLA